MNDAIQNTTKRYLTDDQGNPSSMRLMSMLALITEQPQSGEFKTAPTHEIADCATGSLTAGSCAA